MEQAYEICFYGGLVLAILLLIATIVLFIVLKIPKVIGELTGSTAKKAMKEMKDGTAKPGSIAKKEQEKYYNMGSGKIMAKEAVSSKEERKARGNDSTELLDKNKKKEKKFEETDILRPGVNDYKAAGNEATDVLGSGNPDDEVTDILRDGSTAGDDEVTDILRDGSASGDDEATDVLRGNDEGDDGTTDVLRGNDEGDDGATDVLRGNDEGDDGATDVLRGNDEGDDGETDVLRAEDDGATDVLRAEDDEEGTSVLASPEAALAKKVKVIYNVVVVHSDETLE